jgi:hypothetical protein
MSPLARPCDRQLSTGRPARDGAGTKQPPANVIGVHSLTRRDPTPDVCCTQPRPYTAGFFLFDRPLRLGKCDTAQSEIRSHRSNQQIRKRTGDKTFAFERHCNAQPRSFVTPATDAPLYLPRPHRRGFFYLGTRPAARWDRGQPVARQDGDETPSTGRCYTYQPGRPPPPSDAPVLHSASSSPAGLFSFPSRRYAKPPLR